MRRRTSDNAFERPCIVDGPRLAVAETSWPAAQLYRPVALWRRLERSVQCRR